MRASKQGYQSPPSHLHAFPETPSRAVLFFHPSRLKKELYHAKHSLHSSVSCFAPVARSRLWNHNGIKVYSVALYTGLDSLYNICSIDNVTSIRDAFFVVSFYTICRHSCTYIFLIVGNRVKGTAKGLEYLYFRLRDFQLRPYSFQFQLLNAGPAHAIHDSTKLNMPRVRFGNALREATQLIFISKEHDKTGNGGDSPGITISFYSAMETIDKIQSDSLASCRRLDFNSSLRAS